MKKENLIGKRKSKFEKSLDGMNLKIKSYFGGGEAINGNTTKRIYKYIFEEKYVLLQCFENDPEIIILKIWIILS